MSVLIQCYSQDGMCLNEKQLETNKCNARFKEIQGINHDRIPTFALGGIY